METKNIQLIFFTANHLVGDIVSWQIIFRDLEDLASRVSGLQLMDQGSASCQSWTTMLSEYSEESSSSQSSMPDIPIMDWTYWGLFPEDNVYGERVGEEVVLDEEHTSLLFSENQPLRTDPVDIFIAALFHSFSKVFPDRSVPVIFDEGDGEEPCSSSIDLSSTVGRSTTLVPIYVPVCGDDDPLDILRQTKDKRRMIPECNPVSFFQMQESGIQPEVTFKYTGQEVQTGSNDSPFTIDYKWNHPEMGKAVKRMSVIEIEVAARQNKMHIAFNYHRGMQRQEAVRQWAHYYQSSLEQLLQSLSTCPPSYTISDIPGMGMTHDDLSLLQSKYLPEAGIKVSEVENIYPCSPIQQGILISQTKDPQTYQVYQACEVISRDRPVDVNRLASAWQAVVARHAILRTIFFAASSSVDPFYQVTRKHWKPEVLRTGCLSPYGVIAAFKNLGRPEYAEGHPQHRLAFCETATKQIYLQFNVSHVLLDAPSLQIALQDLFRIYDDSPFHVPAPSYDTYISFLQETPANKSLTYWTDRLKNAPSSNFPRLTTRPSEKRQLRHAVAEFDDVQQVNAFRDTHGVSVANIIQLAWGIILSRYTRSADVLFGSLSNGRDAPIANIDAMVGPMINMTVTRIQLQDGLSLAEAAKKVQDDNLAASHHQRTSLGEIHHALQLGGRRLFNSTVSYKRELVANPADASSLTAKTISAEDPTEYDVNVDVIGGRNRLRLSLQYATSLLDDRLAHRVLDSLQSTLRFLIHNASCQLRNVEVISPTDVELLRQWNMVIPEPKHRMVHDRIAEKNCLSPSSPAVTSWDGQLTYADLNQLADRLAWQLTKLGIHKEVMVGLCFEKSMWAIVSMLAVLRAGGVVVPLGSHLPLQRLQFIVEDTAAPVILTSKSHAGQFKKMSDPAHVLIIDDAFIAELPRKASPIVSLPSGPSNAAAVIYTSGSTGQPKGVVLTHQSLSTSIENHGPKLRIGPNTRAVQFSAYVFDLSLLDIFTTLRFGGCVCVISEEDRMDSNCMAAAMEAMRVNLAVLTPTVAALLQPERVPSLRTLILAGEKLPPTVVDRWYGHASMFNSYGPTECSIMSHISSPIVNKERYGNVGRAVVGTTWVVDPDNHNNLMPIGAVGELLIGGPLLARGYLHNIQQTAESFIFDPGFVKKYGFAAPGGHRLRMYCTGDLVKQDPRDGSIIPVGRVDDQIKIHGQRVEFGEIEDAVKQSLSVQNMAASVFKPEGKNDFLLAVALEMPEIADTTSVLMPLSDPPRQSLLQLSSTLTDFLPSYMVPSFYIPMRKLPLTASGKLDRISLRQVLEGLDDDKLSYYFLADDASHDIRPATRVETKLQDLWASILPTVKDKISINAHFFRTGGDSVSAMRLVSLAQRANPPIDLTVADIFHHPVLSAMASVVETNIGSCCAIDDDPLPFALWNASHAQSDARTSIAAECQVPAEAIEDIHPCSPLQERLTAITARQAQAYMAQFTFRMGDKIDTDRFRNAWQQIFDICSILRTRIVQDPLSGNSMQVVVQQDIPWIDVASELKAFLADDMAKPMGFGNCLSRFAVVRNSSERFFVWTAHHSIYDRYTVQRLLEAVWRVYHNLSVPSFVSYARFIRHLQSVMSTEETNQYWQSQIPQHTQASSFPFMRQGVQLSSCRRFTHSINCTSGQGEITTATLLRSTWALLLSSETDSQNVVFPTTLSGRSTAIPGILDVMGPTITIVPVHIQLDRQQTVYDYLKKVQKQAIDMVPFEHTGLQNIDLPCELQHPFIFQASADQLDQVFSGLEPLPVEAPEFYGCPLVIVCIPLNGSESGININVRFDPTLLPDVKIQSLLEQFEHVFGQLQIVAATKKMSLVGDIDLVSPRDISRLRELNSNTNQITDDCIHKLVHQKVLARPGAPAVCACDGSFSYGRLYNLSSKLAHHLVHIGVGPEVPVALMFEKSRWAVVAELAILIAGGVIVPLHHQNPEGQIQTILEATKTTIMLTSYRNRRFRHRIQHTLVVNEQLIGRLPRKQGSACITVGSKNAAFIIFTTGSTGVPKGVVLEHGSLVTSMQAHGSLYAGSSNRTLQFAAFNFDASISEIFTTLIFGGCICVPSEEARLNDLAAAIQKTSANYAMLTPTVASLLKPEDVPSMKKILFIGEALRQEVVKRWINSSAELHNGYGLTECSILTTFSPRITDPKQASTLGRGLDTCNTWVVNASDYHHLVPIGTVGELLIEGPFLARGYLNDEEKTNDAFVTDPAWSQRVGAGKRRLYRTGDLVRQNPDGSIVYMGRRDTQAKINGQRVEIGEIEFCIKSKLPQVGQVAAGMVEVASSGSGKVLAVAMEMNGLSKEKTSLLPLSDDLQQSFSALRTALHDVLPSYMVPRLYLPFSKLPLTDSGKLDRRGTWTIIQETPSLHEYFLHGKIKIPPSTTTQAQLHKLWADILNIPGDTLGINDDFFRSGGNSITAMQLVTKARADTPRLALKMADIFQFPVLSDMAANTKQLKNEHPIIPAVPYKPFSAMADDGKSVDSLKQALIPLLSAPKNMSIVDAAPTTDTQALFVVGSLRKSRDALAHLSIDGEGLPDIPCWKAACLELTNGHEMLRTSYVYYEKRLIQVVQETYRPYIPVFETGNITIDEFTKELIERDMGRRPQLGRPLVEFAIVTSRQSGCHRIIFRLSHGEYDQMALSYYLDTLQAIYNSQSIAQYPSFCNYIFQLQQHNKEDSRSYWRSLLQRSFMPVIGTRTNKGFQTPAKLIHHKTSRAYATGSLPKSITPSIVIQAAWSLVLACHVGRPDILFGETVSDRHLDDPVSQKAAGPCVNVIPVRVKFDESFTLAQLFHYLQEQHIARQPHEASSHRDILRSCLARPTPYFSSRLNHLNKIPKWSLSMGGVDYRVSMASPESAQDMPDISITTALHGDYVEISFGYLEGIVTPELADNLLSLFRQTLDVCFNGSSDIKLESILSNGRDNIVANPNRGEIVKSDTVQRDLLDAGYAAFALQQQGMDVTIDDILERRTLSIQAKTKGRLRKFGRWFLFASFVVSVFSVFFS
ncbi:hypothetical protein AWENTII_010738 [Aspergillus wentii]